MVSEGYWAERQTLPGMVGRKSTSSSKFWRWRTRSNKSTMSEADAVMYTSPTEPPSMSTLPRQNDPIPLTSPFLSESAHVLSLQHPSQHKEVLLCDGPQLSECSDPDSDRPSSPETVIRVPPSPGSVAKQFFTRAKRGLECRLGLKAAQEVSSSP